MLVILWENNYAALEITDVGIFIFYFIQTSFPDHFLFKLRQNSSVRPRKTDHIKKKQVSSSVLKAELCTNDHVTVECRTILYSYYSSNEISVLFSLVLIFIA